MFKIELDEKILTEAVKIAVNTDIIPTEGYPNVTLEDYLEYTPEDAIKLGVYLTEKNPDGTPRFHWNTDIRWEEREEFETALLTPLIKAALEYYLTKIMERNIVYQVRS